MLVLRGQIIIRVYLEDFQSEGERECVNEGLGSLFSSHVII